MRHIGSLIISAVFAPSIFLLTGTGLSAFNSALDDNILFDPLGSLAALGALLLAGVLYGILVMARLSPLGPGLAGLAAWGISGWALADMGGYKEFFSQLDVHMGGSVGETGLGILLGVPLVATLFSGRRWRKAELYQPPVRDSSDPTWVFPASPGYQSSRPPEAPLPDTPPPSLRYPMASAFPAPQISTPVISPFDSLREPPLDPGRPVSAPPVSAPPVSAPPVSAPPVSAPPASAPPVSAPPLAAPVLSVAPVSGPPAPIVMAAPGEAPPLPKRVPSPPPGSSANNKNNNDVTEQIVSPPPPPDNTETERLAAPGSVAPQPKAAEGTDGDETVQLRPES